MAKHRGTDYEGKRDFTRTTEPKPTDKASGKTGKPLFVIQKHDASTLHYDFRLEIDDTLKSWAIPKGPSTDPRQKRLAIPTEDHPMAYGDYEGVIPEGQYGAGTVMLWDQGEYENIKKVKGTLMPMAACYEQGQIEINLKGKKIQGGYALVRTKGISKGAENWLLIKMKDKYADARRNPVNTENDSVKTGKSLRQIQHTAKK